MKAMENLSLITNNNICHMNKLNKNNIYKGKNEELIYFERSCQPKPMGDTSRNDLGGFKSSCSSIKITKKSAYAFKNNSKKLSSTISKKDSFYYSYQQDEIDAEMSSNRKHSMTLPSPKLNKSYRYSVVPTNEELNNKIDLEIRILDGILKLLNAICNCPSSGSTILGPSLTQANFNSPSIVQLNGSLQSIASSASAFNSLSSSHSNAPASIASILNNTLNTSNPIDQSKCTIAGQAIAAALIGSKPSFAESSSLVFSNFGSNSLSAGHGSNAASADSSSLTSGYSFELNHLYQVLSACKCLFVSHRKIAIYLQNLQKIESTNQRESEGCSSDNDHDADKASLTPSTSSSSSSNLSSNHTDGTQDSAFSMGDRIDGIKLESIKLMLSDIRIPLSWKWSEHVKATKSSENGLPKYATFALIYVGNMVYDTQLILNVDATTTELSFNEVFIFDDVRLKDFQLTIEIYSYELFNTGNNILQSARKLAKQFADFASFKRNTNSLQQQQQQLQSQQATSFSNTMLMSASNHSYSLHKFKLIAKSVLTQKDLSENIESRDLQLLDADNLQPGGVSATSGSSSTLSSSLVYNQNNSSSNKLPLFDYYCCKLRIVPTSSEI